MISGLTRLNLAWPPCNHGNTNATFIEITLPTTKRAARVEAFHFMTAFAHRSIIAGEHHEGIFGDPQFLKFFHQESNVVIHVRNHGRESGLWFALV